MELWRRIPTIGKSEMLQIHITLMMIQIRLKSWIQIHMNVKSPIRISTKVKRRIRIRIRGCADLQD
jgi:hypothetical protein